jgi:hypothetical protein
MTEISKQLSELAEQARVLEQQAQGWRDQALYGRLEELCQSIANDCFYLDNLRQDSNDDELTMRCITTINAKNEVRSKIIAVMSGEPITPQSTT